MVSIKSWAEDDKPREKFLNSGKGVLSDAELIAILLRSGNAKENAIDVARNILRSVDNDLQRLARLTIKELCKFDGVGEVKAITILAALEIGGRKEASTARELKKVSTSRDAYAFFKWRLEDLSYEEFWILTLSRNHAIIKEHRISDGGISGTVVDPKRIYKIALEDNASSIILCHNHPSGNKKPSEQDIKLTRKLKEAGLFLDISILDHIIVAGKDFFSFADEGMM